MSRESLPNHSLEAALLRAPGAPKIFVDANPDDEEDGENVWHDQTEEGKVRRAALENQMGMNDTDRQQAEDAVQKPVESQAEASDKTGRI